MKNSVKAGLFSALIFPGAGHFFLKSYLRGVVLLVPFVTALIYVLNATIERATIISNKILSGEVALDPDAILTLISATPDNTNAFLSKAAMLTLFACWLISIVDSFRLGNIKDNAEKIANLHKQ